MDRRSTTTSSLFTLLAVAVICQQHTSLAFVHPTPRLLKVHKGGRISTPPKFQESPLPTSEKEKVQQVDNEEVFNLDKEVAVVAEEIFDPLHLGHHIIDDSEGKLPAVIEEEEDVSHKEQDDKNQINIWAARGLLLLVAALWGTNFASVKYLETLCFHPPCNHPPSEFAFARFALAGLVSLPLLFRQRMDVIMGGLECGLWITLGYVAQAIALESIVSGKAAFICSLTVVIVPVISALFYGKKITSTNIISGAIALTGVSILEGLVDTNTLLGIQPAVADTAAALETSNTLASAAASAGGFMGTVKSLGLGKGDLLALLQPLGFGLSFLRIEHYVEKFKDVENRVLTIAAAQCVMVGLVSFLWVLYDYNWSLPDFGYMMEPHRIAAIAWTGIVTTVVAIFLEGIALETATASEAALTFSSEPVWASMFGAWLLRERLNANSYVGGAFIMVACLLGAVSDLQKASQMVGEHLEGTDGKFEE